MRKAALVIFIALLAGTIFAQDTPDKIVDISLSPKGNTLKKGSETELEIQVKIKKGWHINANKPLDKNLVATVLTFKESNDYSVSDITYPQPVIASLSFSENELALYDKEISIKAKVKAAKKAKGKITLEGKLQFQPCNDQTCLFPFNKTFKFDLKVN
jgi:DsbC/DsbD-like thiol-disulfide interchange protein